MNAIAATILDQLGGASTLKAMLGVRSFTHDGGSLIIKFRAKGREGINTIKVILDADDTYTVEFWQCAVSLGNIKVNKIETCSGVFAEDLIQVCEDTTGLAFRMPKIHVFRP